MAKVDISVAVEPEEEELVPIEDEDSDDPESEAQKRVIYDLNAANMVPEMMRTKAGIEAVRKIGSRVYDEVKDAWDAQDKYRKNTKKQWMMFAGDLPAKKSGFKDCANLHVPQVLEDVSRLYMRMHSEVVGDGSEFFAVLPIGPDDKDVADILTRHGNHQLRTELIDFSQQMERAALFFIIPGDVTGHSFYDAHRKVNRHEVLTPDDVIVPYVYTTTTPDYSDCPWVAKWLRLYRHELQRYRGMWSDVDKVLERKPSFDEDDITHPLAEGQKKLDGNEPGTDQRAPYKFVHYEGWLELPEQVNELYCKVIVEWQTKTVMLVQLLMEDDWRDRARHEKQTRDLGAFRQGMQAAQESSAAPFGRDPMGQPLPPQVDPMTGMMAQPQIVPPPPPPPWAEDPDALLAPDFEPEPIRQVPIHMFRHGKGIEAPSGPLGMGTGRVLTDLNVVSNIMVNQFIDQGTMANSWGGLFAGGATQVKEIRVQPGVFTPVPGVRPSELKDMFVPMNPPPANQQLFDMVRFVRELSEGASSAPGVLSGEAGKSGETYRGLQTRLEQATKQISFITAKFARFIEGLIQNNARLNAKFLPEEEVVLVNNHKLGTSEELRLGRKLYERDYRVYMKSDLRFASQEARVAEADQLFAMVAAPNPAIPQNPALIQAAMREVFVARGKDELVPLLGPPMPPPPTPMNLPPPPPIDPATGLPMQQQPQPQPGAPAQPGQPGAPGQGAAGGPQPQRPQLPQNPQPAAPPRPAVSNSTASPGGA